LLSLFFLSPLHPVMRRRDVERDRLPKTKDVPRTVPLVSGLCVFDDDLCEEGMMRRDY
jgi:hypothetical protein